MPDLALVAIVAIVVAMAALWALLYAARPPDEDHAFGHDKAEYFSSGLEGVLILVAAGIGAVGSLGIALVRGTTCRNGNRNQQHVVRDLTRGRVQ